MSLLDPDQRDENRDFLKELIGEGGKFHDADEKSALQKLARGKVESDAYVKTLESQLDDMRADTLKWRDEASARASLEELVTKLSSNRNDNNDANNLNANMSQNTQTPPVLDPKTVEELVAKKLTEVETAKLRESNYNTVINRVKEVYGGDYANSLRRQATDLGMSGEEVDELARNNPKIFMRTFGLDRPGQNNFQTPPTGVRSSSFAPTTNTRSWSYYQKLRLEQPKVYYDKKTQVQMHKDAYELGDAFKDGDWSA